MDDLDSRELALAYEAARSALGREAPELLDEFEIAYPAAHRIVLQLLELDGDEDLARQDPELVADGVGITEQQFVDGTVITMAITVASTMTRIGLRHVARLGVLPNLDAWERVFAARSGQPRLVGWIRERVEAGLREWLNLNRPPSPK